MQKTGLKVRLLALLFTGGALYAPSVQADKAEATAEFCCCRTFQVGPGPEDFEFDLPHKRLLISSVVRRAGSEKTGGNVLAVPLADNGDLEKPVALPLNGRDGSLFHPIGISLVRDGEVSKLYVIVRNFQSGHNAVERFRIGDGELHFEDRFSSDLLVSPNDLLALENGEIYVSNDSGGSGFIITLFERLFRIHRSSVVHYDGKGHWQKVAGRIAFANGLAFDQRAQELYVTAFQEKRILVYRRDSGTGQLTRSRAIKLPAAPDNLMWEDEDHLLVAAHGSILRTGLHQSFGADRAPSMLH